MTEHHDITTLIANRYKPIEKLGAGGMGAVFSVTDLLTSSTLALKRVLVPASNLDFSLSNSSQNQYVALAQEFRTLSTLRHPNIIGVQDYGFDEEGQPFFTMEFLPDSQTITDYAQNQLARGKIRLLTETLQALAYLHRRGIIHRDIKPGNVLVHQGTVKVLDFGLAISRSPDEVDEDKDSTSGTMAYMAPEQLRGTPASVQSDLYAVGIIAYEMFLGEHPYDLSSFMTLMDDVLRKVPDVNAIDPTYGIFIQKMIAKMPDVRPPSAMQAVNDLYMMAGRTPPDEKSTIRESFLQASSFVGRKEELRTFRHALSDVKDNNPSAWLLGGESGVGKSRLIDELRSYALVEGIKVLRGQSADNGLPYQLWRNVIRPLALSATLTDLEAGILREIVPDIDQLLERDIPDVPALSGKANQDRLSQLVTDVFKRQSQPILLILEDLHWAEEGNEILKRLLEQFENLSLMIIGTYRSDETPNLPDELPQMTDMKLARLDDDAIAQLSYSMLGDSGRDQTLVEFLNKETEGNVFFMVEVVRALAEQAGRLDDIGKSELPQQVMAGGMQAVLRRRLSRVPEWANQLLKLSAIYGRQIDTNILGQAIPDADLEAFITAGANAAVFDIVDETWQFTHDKLRETLISDLDADDKSSLHQTIAESIERTYPDDIAYAEMLAIHWDNAGISHKAVPYILNAANYMIRVTSDNKRAQSLLERGIELATSENIEILDKLYKELGELNTRLGNYDLAVEHYEHSLNLAKNNVHIEITALARLSFIYWQQGNLDKSEEFALKSLELATKNDDDQGIGLSHYVLGWLADSKGEFEKSQKHLETTLNIWESLGDEVRMAGMLSDIGISYAKLGDLKTAEDYFKRSLGLNEKLGVRTDMAAALSNLGMVYSMRNQNNLAEETFLKSLTINRDTGNKYGEAITLHNLGNVASAQGNFDTALTYFDQSLVLYRQLNITYEMISILNEKAYIHIQRDEISSAKQILVESLELAIENSYDGHIMTAICIGSLILLKENRVKLSASLMKFAKDQDTTPPDSIERLLKPVEESLAMNLSDDELKAYKTHHKYEDKKAAVQDLKGYLSH